MCVKSSPQALKRNDTGNRKDRYDLNKEIRTKIKPQRFDFIEDKHNS